MAKTTSGRSRRKPAARRTMTKKSAAPTTKVCDLSLALSLAKDGRTADALQAVESILSQNPDDWTAHRLAGILLWQLGRDAETALAFLQAFNHAPAEGAVQGDLAHSIVAIATDMKEVKFARTAFDISIQTIKRFGATEELLTKTVGLRLFLS